MSNIRLTKIFNFDSAHALYNHDGLCRSIHGHSYKLHVTVMGKAEINENSPKLGMVIDFGVLKKIINNNIIDKYDHSLMLYKKEELNFSNNSICFERLHYFDFQPTCENLIVYFADIIERELPDNIELIGLKLYETESSYAEWYKSDQ